MTRIASVDRVALITGASGGIGRATAVTLAKAGTANILVDIEPSGLSETLHIIKEFGGSGCARVCDVSNEDALKLTFESALEEYGRLDIAFNNAGIAPGSLKPMTEVAISEWQRMLAVNVTSVWLGIQHAARIMKHQGQGGVILNTASVAGLIGLGGSAAYTACKHAVIGLTKAAAIELAADKIRVNAICPGYIRTPMTQQIVANNRAKRSEATITDRIPLSRWGSAEEIARWIEFLCSDAAAFATGQSFTIDGGLTTQGFGR